MKKPMYMFLMILSAVVFIVAACFLITSDAGAKNDDIRIKRYVSKQNGVEHESFYCEQYRDGNWVLGRFFSTLEEACENKKQWDEMNADSEVLKNEVVECPHK